MDDNEYSNYTVLRENVRLQFENEQLHKTLNESLEELNHKRKEVRAYECCLLDRRSLIEHQQKTISEQSVKLQKLEKLLTDLTVIMM